MIKYQQGDHLAFNAIYARHKNKVYSYLAKRVYDRDQLDDLFQRVFTKFHKSRHLYQYKYELLPWIYTITKSEFLDFIKKRKFETIELDESLLINQFQKTEDYFDLETEKNLNDKEKIAIEHRYYNEKEFAEIALILNTTTSNTRKIISRAIKKLRMKYRGENNEQRL